MHQPAKNGSMKNEKALFTIIVNKISLMIIKQYLTIPLVFLIFFLIITGKIRLGEKNRKTIISMSESISFLCMMFIYVPLFSPKEEAAPSNDKNVSERIACKSSSSPSL